MKNEDGGGAGGDTNTSPSRKDAQNKVRSLPPNQIC